MKRSCIFNNLMLNYVIANLQFSIHLLYSVLGIRSCYYSLYYSIFFASDSHDIRVVYRKIFPRLLSNRRGENLPTQHEQNPLPDSRCAPQDSVPIGSPPAHPAHTCIKPGHACLRSIVSIVNLPGRRTFHRIGRAIQFGGYGH